MSHVVSIQTELRSLEAIKAACKRAGWEFRQGQKTFEWFGEYIGDSALPTHFLTDEQQLHLAHLDPDGKRKYLTELFGQCDHAISIPGCSYEVGLCLRQHSDGTEFYVPVWDYWGQGGLHKVLGQDGGPLLQNYGVCAAALQAQNEGYTVAEEALPNGSIKLSLTRY